MSRNRLPQMFGRFGFLLSLLVVAPVGTIAQAPATAGDVTFTKDIAPVLQRSCQQCHHADGVAPMPLITYDEVSPYPKPIKPPTPLRPHPAPLPPCSLH